MSSCKITNFLGMIPRTPVKRGWGSKGKEGRGGKGLPTMFGRKLMPMSLTTLSIAGA